MSGHSKWATTKRKKARIDAGRAKAFNRIIREITVATRLGGSEVAANPRLRSAVLKARAVNMPAKNIDTAIAKGAGETEGAGYQEITYEGYGPGGIAVLVDCLTDNKTRTVADLRHLFGRHGGNLGEVGSVAWMFQNKGVLTVSGKGTSEEALMEAAAEAGAEDLFPNESAFEVVTALDSMHAVLDALSAHAFEVCGAEPVKIAETRIQLEGETAQKASQLLDALDDHDDVQNVFTNADLDIPDKDTA